ncbi:MAG: KAP family NTPase [Methylorubrum extorquens]|jgi:hypothetical protein|uniref:KAP family P-loop NTPase fold protein n=1 Tax=Methylorubrum extorquens TaxID=408 RepID=UPI002FEE042D
MQLQSANPIRRREDDRFGRWGFACALADLVDNASPNGAVVVGVEGPWGSGKSSVLEMTAHELLARGGHRVVRVSAWRTTSQEQFLASLAYGIAFALRRDWSAVWFRLFRARLLRQPMPTWLGLLFPVAFVAAILLVPGLADRVKPFAKADVASVLAGLGVVGAPIIGLLLTYAAKPLVSSFGGITGRDGLADKSGAMEQFAYELDVLAEAQVGRGRFVILVEDLDRTTPERVVDVLGAVAQLCGHERADRLAFLVAYDRDKVLAAVEGSLTKAQEKLEDIPTVARGYVDRVIQVGLPLPAKGSAAGPAAGRGRVLRFPGPIQAALIVTVAVTLLCHALLQVGQVPFGLDLVAAAAFFGLVVGSLLTTQAFDTHGPSSDPAWDAAADEIKPLMPDNPRDAVRVANIARAAVALDGGSDGLTRTEALAVAATEVKFPGALDVGRIRTAMQRGHLGQGAFMNAEFSAVLATLSGAGVQLTCFSDPNRLFRYFRAVRGA